MLCRDPELAEALEKTGDLAARLGGSKEFDESGYRIAFLSEVLFFHDRKEYDAVAIQLRKPEVKAARGTLGGLSLIDGSGRGPHSIIRVNR